MKKLIKLLIPLIIIFLCYKLFYSVYENSSLFHKDGVPTSALKKVFSDLGISITTLQGANKFAQDNFLRVGERWDKQLSTPIQNLMRANEQKLLEDLRVLGMMDAVAQAKKEYVYALLMGATKGTLSCRIDSLVELCKNGYAFKYIVLLSGERPLRDIEKDGLPEDVLTEVQMTIYFCKKNPVLKNYNILVVNAPVTKDSDGNLIRPTTDTTIEYFAKIAPVDGSCLVISNNPYIIRQTKVVRSMLDQSRFPADGFGVAFKKGTLDIVILMDEFARTLFEECKGLA